MKKILILIACTLVTVSIFANQDVSECSSIKDDTERLTCYDKFFSSSNDLVVINSDTVIEIKEVETEELETINNENSLLAETTKETDLEEKKIESTTVISLKASEEVIQKFLKIKFVKRKGSNFSIELNDGSVWRTNESIWNKSLLKAEVDVLIEKGSFGSHFIKFKGTKTKIRVKKIK